MAHDPNDLESIYADLSRFRDSFNSVQLATVDEHGQPEARRAGLRRA